MAGASNRARVQPAQRPAGRVVVAAQECQRPHAEPHVYPADAEAEIGVLGARLDSHVMPPELARVSEAEFADPRHALIWRYGALTAGKWEAVGLAMQAAGERDRAEAIRQRGHAMDALGDLVRVGGWEFLTDLMATWRGWLRFRGVGHYLERLVDAARRRAVLETAAEIAEASYRAKDGAALARWGSQRLAAVAARRVA